MQLRIDNYRGVKEADIELVGVCLVTGDNTAGKTSMAQAAAAAVTGSTIPIPDLKKMDAGALVRTGHDMGSATITNGEHWQTVNWPGAKASSEGTPPSSSLYGAGLASISALKTVAERALELAPYLNAEPTKDDLAAALQNFTEELLDKLWGKIDVNGWDLQWEATKDKGKDMKGRWHQATGQAYGSKKAASWHPAEWGADMEAASEQSLEAALTQEQEFLEASIASTAISQDERDRLEKLAATIDDKTKKMEAADADHGDARAAAIKASTELEALPEATQPTEIPTQDCPHCGKPLIVSGSTLKMPDTTEIDKPEMDRRTKAREIKTEEVLLLRAASREKLRHLAVTEQRVDEAKAAKETFDALPPAQDGEAPDVEKARETVRRAEARRDAFKKKREADRIHATIELNQSIIDALAPTGIRASKLRKAIGAFETDRLEPLCKIAGWEPVTINSDDLMPQYGVRKYLLAAESEQYRADVVMQAAMAISDGSELIVIDRGDCLDRVQRKRLFKMLVSTKIPALVFMTITDESGPPDLQEDGIGKTYILENAKVRGL